MVSTQSTHYRNSRTKVKTLLRSARPEKRSAEGRAAERLQGQAALRARTSTHAAPQLKAPRHLRREVRKFCVAQRPHARAELAGRPCDRAVKRVLERQAARVVYRGEPAAHPRVEALRRRGRAAGWCEGQLMAGKSPKVPSAAVCGLRLGGHQNPRAAGEAQGAVEVGRSTGPYLQFGSRLHLKSTFAGLRKNKKMKTRGVPKKGVPGKKEKGVSFGKAMTLLEMQPGAKLLRISRVFILQPHACAQRFRL